MKFFVVLISVAIALACQPHAVSNLKSAGGGGATVTFKLTSNDSGTLSAGGPGPGGLQACAGANICYY